jgi:hypothetical protein
MICLLWTLDAVWFYYKRRHRESKLREPNEGQLLEVISEEPTSPELKNVDLKPEYII